MMAMTRREAQRGGVGAELFEAEGEDGGVHERHGELGAMMAQRPIQPGICVNPQLANAALAALQIRRRCFSITLKW
jgi:hypothetical protein